MRTSTWRVASAGLALAAACSSSTHAVEDASPDAGLVLAGLTVVPNPNSVLSATVQFTTGRPVQASAHVVNLWAAANTFDTPRSSPSTKTSIPLLGMRAQSDFTITVTATDASGNTATASVPFHTPALPPTFPPITVLTNDTTRTAPGYLVLDLWEFSGTPQARIGAQGSAVVALDADMQVVWYYDGVPLTDPEKVAGGFYALEGFNDVPSWYEVDMMGNLVASRTAAQLQLDSLSHAITPEQADLLSVAPTLRMVGGFPAPDGGTQILPIVGSLVVSMGYDGGASVLANTFDFFDVHYQGNLNSYNASFWDKTYPDAGATRDWTHDNSVAPDPTDGTIVASAHTLNWIYKVRRDGSLLWKLGPAGDFTLTNPGETFQYGQHGTYVTPTGTVMCFDDGNGRPLAPGQTPFSRALEYSLDTTKMEATIVWQYEDDFDSSVYGNANLLSNGDVLVDDGCELATRGGLVADPQNLKSARVEEVTHATPAEKLLEIRIDVPLGAFAPDPLYSGFTVYRAYKWPSLY